ncbi:class I SAM-dependent methyltransferase [Plesiomonas shigelloides]|uniref:class I SAM-dependent methyltransferase n=1 Tax=Plesiomonas shigelloides TaxID=703 RepID=UPI0022473DF9|nr:class I SAM-dependent methyltransferase [Plesiomonas shigelloides]MCX2532813.1 class I SAM-dependent methyltransferase [Plesiomonas shigelloides]
MQTCAGCCSKGSIEKSYIKNGCQIYTCKICGLGFSDINNFSPSDYYSSEYFDGTHDDGYLDYVGSEVILRKEFSTIVERIVKSIEQGNGTKPNLLEVGCAYGFFLKEASTKFQTFGIEISHEAAEFCQNEGLSVVAGEIDSMTLERFGNVDVIVMLDVIEHLMNPKKTLELCADHLNRGGMMYITTGDFSSFVAKVLGKNWRLMTPPQHLWFFSKKSIETLAKETGFEVVSITKPWKMVPLSLIVFQLLRIFGVKLSSRFEFLSKLGLPVNLFDAMHIILKKKS